MSVAVQVVEAHRPGADIGQCMGHQGARCRQLAAPQQTGNLHTALAGQNHGPAVQVHQNPQADGAEQLIALFVISYGGAGVGGAGGWHGPGLHPDGFAPQGKSRHLDPVADHGPEEPAAGQGVIVQGQVDAVQAGDVLGVKENHGGLQPPEAVHLVVGDGVFVCIDRFQFLLPRFQNLVCVSTKRRSLRGAKRRGNLLGLPKYPWE